jgi:hypothetical protein
MRRRRQRQRTIPLTEESATVFVWMQGNAGLGGGRSAGFIPQERPVRPTRPVASHALGIRTFRRTSAGRSKLHPLSITPEDLLQRDGAETTDSFFNSFRWRVGKIKAQRVSAFAVQMKFRARDHGDLVMQGILG